jgi:hypothetical protein
MWRQTLLRPILLSRSYGVKRPVHTPLQHHSCSTRLPGREQQLPSVILCHAGARARPTLQAKHNCLGKARAHSTNTKLLQPLGFDRLCFEAFIDASAHYISPMEAKRLICAVLQEYPEHA